MTSSRRTRRAILPLGVFLAVALVHYVLVGLFTARDAAQDRWVAVPAVAGASWLQRYLETGSYWLGYSYALSLAFAALALRRYREDRQCAARTLAIGGVTLSGFLAVAGCYLIGCCGSPMLAVYLSLFGATFLPFAKPLVAGLATLSILAAWWWMEHRRRRALLLAATCTGRSRVRMLNA
jgi:hypothetical protein